MLLLTTAAVIKTAANVAGKKGLSNIKEALNSAVEFIIDNETAIYGAITAIVITTKEVSDAIKGTAPDADMFKIINNFDKPDLLLGLTIGMGAFLGARFITDKLIGDTIKNTLEDSLTQAPKIVEQLVCNMKNHIQEKHNILKHHIKSAVDNAKNLISGNDSREL